MRVLLGVLLLSAATSIAESEPPSIHVETDVQERYYDVYGRNADEVFASIQRQGLGDQAGLAASGLTQSEIAFTLKTTTTETSCRLTDVTLRARVSVTLPRHAKLADVDASTRRLWEIYETQVEFHEQRHVEIEFQGIQELQERLSRESVQASSGSARACNGFVQRAIEEQSRVTKQRHEEFHAEETRAVRDAQSTLLAEITSVDAELRRQKGEIDRLDAAQAELFAAREGYASALNALIERYGRELPPDAFAQAEATNEAIEGLTEEMSRTSALRKTLVARYDEGLSDRTDLTTRLAWTR